MSLLMDALRRAEAEKKSATARDDDLSIDLPDTSGELRLEPLETSTERPMRVLDDDTLYDQQAAPTRQQYVRPGAGREPAADPELNPFLTAPVGPGSAAQPTVVTAQTVFEATRASGIPRALIAVIVSTVLLAAGLTAVGVYAYRQAPPAHTIPSPRVAAQLERPAAAPALTPPAIPPTPSPASAAPTPPAPAVIAVADPVIEPAPVIAAADAADAADAAAAVVANEAPATTPRPAPTAAPVAVAPPLERMLPAEIPRDAEITSGEVRIARRSTAAGQADDVTRAYGAFQLGKLAVAQTLYQRALAAEPDRIDALLGLAAIALRENRIVEAHRRYREVLAKSPRHPVASAALFMIEGGDGNATSEARLKLLAERDADSPYLHFALGNLYARQKRWADAQEAYFAAHTRAPLNADYAYNLAVSLDHLGQRKAALEYYRKALALRAPGAAFDATRAHGRIAALVGAP